jgi:alanyl-tRNA synthetase
MTSQELRASFVEYFVSKGHVHLPRASLVPDKMSTTLFTIAGMEQFVPVFLGEVPPPAPRAVTVQPCLRVAGAKSDIENVGRTGRHGTFLEMLGNFSFGDYYKRDAILFAWEYMTQRLRFDPNRLWVTVHTGDDEAANLWESEIGLPAARISRFDDDNFWTMGPTGPCGPSSEIFVDTGIENASGPEDTGPNLGARFVEAWNLVFQQFNRTQDGVLHELPRKAIDTGAGFERMLAVANGVTSMYETDLFTDLIAAQPQVSGSPFDAAESLVRRRIIADHARAVTFLIADGVYPGNTERGYVLRFLIRRAIRNGRLLGYPGGFLTELVPAVVKSLGPGYPELAEARQRVEQTLGGEETAFNRTLERGSEMLARLIESAKGRGVGLTGNEVFTLHDTYGFPSELTREIAAEAGLSVDTAGFESAMTEQRERAREDARRKRAVVSAILDESAAGTALAEATEFTGYDGLETDAAVIALLRNGRSLDEVEAGSTGDDRSGGDGDSAALDVVLDRTSFYAEKGGQIGDQGTIVSDDAAFDVNDTQFLAGSKVVVHRGTLRRGTLRVGDRVSTAVSPQWREEIRREHSSVHLLQRALKEIVGEEVQQAGSWVGIDRQRFDFRGPALTSEQRAAVQRRVNQLIRADYHRDTIELPIEEAKKTGAVTMAGEDYGDRVRVVTFGPSKEFCGGTHAETTGELGMFIITGESSIGSGIRRIESVVSKAADAYVEQQQSVVATLSESLSSKPEELTERIGRLQSEVREAQKTAAELRSQLASADAAEYVERAESIRGNRFVSAVISDADGARLRDLGNAIRSRLRSGVIALAGVQNGTVALLVTVSDDLTKSGLHAGNLLKVAAPLVDGRGGGAPTQAQGGGKNPAGAQAALDAVRSALAG